MKYGIRNSPGLIFKNLITLQVITTNARSSQGGISIWWSKEYATHPKVRGPVRTYGSERSSRKETMWGLSPIKRHHHPGSLSSTLPVRFWKQTTDYNNIFHNGSDKSIPPNSSCRGRHPKNSNHNSIWPVQISIYEVRIMQCSAIFPEIHGHRFPWLGLVLLLQCWRASGIQECKWINITFETNFWTLK